MKIEGGQRWIVAGKGVLVVIVVAQQVALVRWLSGAHPGGYVGDEGQAFGPGHDEIPLARFEGVDWALWPEGCRCGHGGDEHEVEEAEVVCLECGGVCERFGRVGSVLN